MSLPIGFGCNRQLRYFISKTIMGTFGCEYVVANREVIRLFNPWHATITRNVPEDYTYNANTADLYGVYNDLYRIRLSEMVYQLGLKDISTTVPELSRLINTGINEYNKFTSGDVTEPKPGIIPKVYAYRYPAGDRVVVIAGYDLTDCARCAGFNIDRFKKSLKRLDQMDPKKLHPKLAEAMDLALKQKYNVLDVTARGVKYLPMYVNTFNSVVE